MPHTWQKALNSYRYRVCLADFEDAQTYRCAQTCRRWFEHDTGIGDRSSTMEFEDRFRKLGPYHLEAWYEVVFWKMYSQRGAASHRSRTVIGNIKASGLSAGELWNLCQDYIQRPCLHTFRPFRKKFARTTALATAATFPAFICPELFPMVDNQVAKWVQANGSRHGISPSPKLKGTVLHENDWDFVQAWIDWCRHTADILNRGSDQHWRARDVEMAVFAAQPSDLPRLGS